MEDNLICNINLKAEDTSKDQICLSAQLHIRDFKKTVKSLVQLMVKEDRFKEIIMTAAAVYYGEEIEPSEGKNDIKENDDVETAKKKVKNIL